MKDKPATYHSGKLARQNEIRTKYNIPAPEINFCEHTTIDGIMILIEGLAIQVRELKMALESVLGDDSK